MQTGKNSQLEYFQKNIGDFGEIKQSNSILDRIAHNKERYLNGAVLFTTEFANTVVDVSEMCLGTMMFGDRCDEAKSVQILDTAVSQGVTFIDTAASYCGSVNEEILGRIIKGKRGELFIGTKVTKNTNADWSTQSLDESLTRLQTDYAHLFMIHWPRENMQIGPMMAAFNDAVQAGKTRFVGCCNFPAWLLAHCNALAPVQQMAKAEDVN